MPHGHRATLTPLCQRAGSSCGACCGLYNREDHGQSAVRERLDARTGALALVPRTPEAFGAGALAFSVVAYTASSLKAAFFADNLALNAVFVFLGKWIADLIFVAAEHRLGGSEFLAQSLLWSPLSAAVTAAVGLAVLVLVRPVVGTPRG